MAHAWAPHARAPSPAWLSDRAPQYNPATRSTAQPAAAHLHASRPTLVPWWPLPSPSGSALACSPAHASDWVAVHAAVQRELHLIDRAMTALRRAPHQQQPGHNHHNHQAPRHEQPLSGRQAGAASGATANTGSNTKSSSGGGSGGMAAQPGPTMMTVDSVSPSTTASPVQGQEARPVTQVPGAAAGVATTAVPSLAAVASPSAGVTPTSTHEAPAPAVVPPAWTVDAAASLETPAEPAATPADLQGSSLPSQDAPSSHGQHGGTSSGVARFAAAAAAAVAALFLLGPPLALLLPIPPHAVAAAASFLTSALVASGTVAAFAGVAISLAAASCALLVFSTEAVVRAAAGSRGRSGLPVAPSFKDVAAAIVSLCKRRPIAPHSVRSVRSRPSGTVATSGLPTEVDVLMTAEGTGLGASLAARKAAVSPVGSVESEEEEEEEEVHAEGGDVMAVAPHSVTTTAAAAVAAPAVHVLAAHGGPTPEQLLTYHEAERARFERRWRPEGAGREKRRAAREARRAAQQAADAAALAAVGLPAHALTELQHVRLEAQHRMARAAKAAGLPHPPLPPLVADYHRHEAALPPSHIPIAAGTPCDAAAEPMQHSNVLPAASLPSLSKVPRPA